MSVLSGQLFFSLTTIRSLARRGVEKRRERVRSLAVFNAIEVVGGAKRRDIEIGGSAPVRAAPQPRELPGVARLCGSHGGDCRDGEAEHAD